MPGVHRVLHIIYKQAENKLVSLLDNTRSKPNPALEQVLGKY